MAFSNEWDKCYKENTHFSVWPWSDLVSYVRRYVRPTGKDFRVLELGCGAGANIPFFVSLGVNYYAIEGSRTIVEKLHKKYPEFAEKIVEGDFTTGIPFQESYDLVVDRSAVTHNTTSGIRKCLEHVNKKLKRGGKYIGIDWFSTTHSEYTNGKETDDVFTRNSYQNGMFAHVGMVHFSDKLHLLDLFKEFDIVHLDHKIIKTEIPNEYLIAAYWNFMAHKK